MSKGLEEARLLNREGVEEGSHPSLGSSGDILLYDSQVVLYKQSLDVMFYVIGPADENPLILSTLMGAIFDSISLLLRGQVEKRAILENLDLVTLAVDECVDDG